MTKIDWTGTPMQVFLYGTETLDDGTMRTQDYPLGDGAPQRLIMHLYSDVDAAYERLISPEDFEHLEETGEVPVIRGESAERTYERLEDLTLSDLPAVLDTLAELEAEHKRREADEAERKAQERKERERVRAKERRKLKKLGEW